ncbi:MAG: hypothetical protein JWM74_4880 [Myxococcaceae bacterium]|nr:hypothetical protein [Myxococcaceae bacterium]
MNAARHFQLIPTGARAPAGAAGCDGVVPGAAIDLSHWEGNTTAAEYKADTSTEIALRFARSGGTVDLAVNNHFDADGVLAVYALLRSDVAMANADLLVAAAEVGDFDEWPSDERGLRLEAALRRMAMLKSDEAAYARVIRELESVVANLDQREDLWGEEWRALERARARLARGEVEASIEGSVAVFIHHREVAELRGPVLTRAARHLADVLHVDAPTSWLLAFERDRGTWDYRYELARHAWADTVVRPKLQAPSRNATAVALSHACGVPFASWALKGDLGMTGVLRTATPVKCTPVEVARALRDGSTTL